MLAHSDETKDMVTRPLEFLGNIMLLIVGGNDTTRNSITGGVLALNQFAEEYSDMSVHMPSAKAAGNSMIAPVTEA